MSQRVNTLKGQKRRGRGLIQILSAAAFVSAILYWEQTAILYVLSTLAMCGLLLVVAFSDMEGRDRELSDSTLTERADTAGDNEMTIASSTRRARRPASQKHQDAA